MAFNNLPDSTPDQISGIPNPSIQELLLKRLVWPSAASEPKATLERPVPENHRHTQSIPFGLPDIDNDLPDRGLPRGAIHEFFYNDPLLPKAVASTIPILLAYNCLTSGIAVRESDRFNQATLDHKCPPSIVWIGRPCWPTPQALNAVANSPALDGASFLANSLFINPPNDATTLWAIELALKSQAINLVIAACPNISRQTTQRLAISARRYSTTALLLRSPNQITIPSHASSRWEVSPTPSNSGLSNSQSPSWSLRLCKLKGAAAKGQSWIVSINELDPLLDNVALFSGYRAPTQEAQTDHDFEQIPDLQTRNYSF